MGLSLFALCSKFHLLFIIIIIYYYSSIAAPLPNHPSQRHSGLPLSEYPACVDPAINPVHCLSERDRWNRDLAFGVGYIIEAAMVTSFEVVCPFTGGQGAWGHGGGGRKAGRETGYSEGWHQGYMGRGFAPPLPPTPGRPAYTQPQSP